MPLPRLEVRERPASETTVYHQGELVSPDGAPPDGVGDVGDRGAKRPKVGGSIERYCDLDLDRLTIGPELKGNGNAGLRFARVAYRGQRLELQLTKGSGVDDAMRVPFGLDRGSPKFPDAKPTIKLELNEDQVSFLRRLETKVVAAAIEHKADWFAGALPTDDEVRAGFCSRIRVDANGVYQPTLSINCNLAGDKPMKVHIRRLVSNGAWLGAPGSPNDIQPSTRPGVRGVIPKLRSNGVWIKQTERLSFGLVFEAIELEVVQDEHDMPKPDPEDDDDFYAPTLFYACPKCPGACECASAYWTEGVTIQRRKSETGTWTYSTDHD